MSKKIRNTEVDHLFDAILTLENKEECYTFFEDVCTVNELLSISQRYEVAKMLREGKTYLDISNATREYSTFLKIKYAIMKMRNPIWKRKRVGGKI